MSHAEEVKAVSQSVCLGDDQLEFLRRMNRTFVNEAGSYLKFNFSGTVFSGPRLIKDNKLRYYDKDYHSGYPFSQVQSDANEIAVDLVQRKVELPTNFKSAADGSATWIVDQSLGFRCAFVYNSYCFIGKITTVSCDNFRDKDAVTEFFVQSKLGRDCYVDAKGTTFFVLKDSTDWYKNVDKVVPSFV